MGATRSALVTEVLSESLLLAAGGAALGGLFALAAIAGIRQVIPRTVPRWDQIAVGWDLLAYSGGLALAGLLFSGLFPIWKISRGGTWDALRTGSAQGGRGRRDALAADSRRRADRADRGPRVRLRPAGAQRIAPEQGGRRFRLRTCWRLRVPYDFRKYPNNRRARQL
jgi:hypothetical protein